MGGLEYLEYFYIKLACPKVGYTLKKQTLHSSKNNLLAIVSHTLIIHEHVHVHMHIHIHTHTHTHTLTLS